MIEMVELTEDPPLLAVENGVQHRQSIDSECRQQHGDRAPSVRYHPVIGALPLQGPIIRYN